MDNPTISPVSFQKFLSHFLSFVANPHDIWLRKFPWSWSSIVSRVNQCPPRDTPLSREPLRNRHVVSHRSSIHVSTERFYGGFSSRSRSRARIPAARGFTRQARRGRRRRRRGTKGVGALISAPGARLVALHRPASIRTAYFRSPFYARLSTASAAAAAAAATAAAGTLFPWTTASHDGCSAFDTSTLASFFIKKKFLFFIFSGHVRMNSKQILLDESCSRQFFLFEGGVFLFLFFDL